MDCEFTRPAKRGGRVIVASQPSSANDKHNIGVGFDQRRANSHFISLDRDAFSDHAAVTPDRRADHWPVAVLPCSCLRRLGDQYPHTWSADDWNPGQPGNRQQSYMARRKPRSGRNQHRSDRRDRALLLDIVTGHDCLDGLDAGLSVELGQLKRDHSVGPGWQSFAGAYCNQWQPNWIVGARPERRARLDSKPVPGCAIA
jgi:hypothetical protein